MNTISKRDFFAAAVLIAQSNTSRIELYTPDSVAEKCFDIASAMVRESEKYRKSEE